MGVSVQYTKYIWCWSYRFIHAVHASDLKLYLMIDTREDAEKYESLPVDGFITAYIEIVGKNLKHPDGCLL